MVSSLKDLSTPRDQSRAFCGIANPRVRRASKFLERETGIEPATNSLEGCDSTTELLPPLKPAISYQPSAFSLTSVAPSSLFVAYRAATAFIRSGIPIAAAKPAKTRAN